jgi:YfiR/HmsC-like
MMQTLQSCRQSAFAAVSMPRTRLPLFAFVPLVALMMLSALPVQARGSHPTQYDVEAAYLYQFGNFVQWPAKSGADRPKTFSICVLGQDPFGTALEDTLRDSKMNGLPMEAKRIASVRDAAGCQILFISSSQQDQLTADLLALREQPVLTVSDIPEFAARGGVIQFVLTENRVRFEIDLSNAQKAGLKLSSQLLKVAVAVRGGANSK